MYTTVVSFIDEEEEDSCPIHRSPVTHDGGLGSLDFKHSKNASIGQRGPTESRWEMKNTFLLFRQKSNKNVISGERRRRGESYLVTSVDHDYSTNGSMYFIWRNKITANNVELKYHWTSNAMLIIFRQPRRNGSKIV